MPVDMTDRRRYKDNANVAAIDALRVAQSKKDIDNKRIKEIRARAKILREKKNQMFVFKSNLKESRDPTQTVEGTNFVEVKKLNTERLPEVIDSAPQIDVTTGEAESGFDELKLGIVEIRKRYAAQEAKAKEEEKVAEIRRQRAKAKAAKKKKFVKTNTIENIKIAAKRQRGEELSPEPRVVTPPLETADFDSFNADRMDIRSIMICPKDRVLDSSSKPIREQIQWRSGVSYMEDSRQAGGEGRAKTVKMGGERFRGRDGQMRKQEFQQQQEMDEQTLGSRYQSPPMDEPATFMNSRNKAG